MGKNSPFCFLSYGTEIDIFPRVLAARPVLEVQGFKAHNQVRPFQEIPEAPIIRHFFLLLKSVLIYRKNLK